MVVYRPRAVARLEDAAKAANACTGSAPSSSHQPSWSKFTDKYSMPVPGAEKPMVLQSLDDEFEAYVNLSMDQFHEFEDLNSQLVEFWDSRVSCDTIYPTGILLRRFQKARRSYPTLHEMALDYLPIQASSVPCERAFSSSAETDTKKRNRLSPVMFEALQLLKHWFKRGRMSSMARWNVSNIDLMAESVDYSVDHLASLMAASAEKREAIINKIVTAVDMEEGVQP